MMKVPVFILVILIAFSCSEKKKVACDPSDGLSKVIDSWGEKNGSEGDLTCSKIVDFPKKVESDTQKNGIEYELNFANGAVLIQDYTFSEKFIKDHALEATLAEFMQDDAGDFAYFRAINIPPSGCLVVKIKSSQLANELGKEKDNLIDQCITHFK
ncbi:MAG: hypothetical protein HYZ42_09945 [Bacteroidetes bacterium]|nr:hypothetical protein [Bacteroidota bacterium]